MKFKILFSLILLTGALKAQVMLPAFQGTFNVQNNDANANNALHFNGTPDYATLPAGVYFNGDLTIECWVFPTAFTSWSRIMDFGNGAGSNNVLLGYTVGTSGSPVFHVGGAQFQATQTIPLNQWSHVAATLEGTTATIYINGSAAGTATFPIPAEVTRNNNYIGRSNWGADQDASAVFDEFRIWNVARTAAEIQSNMYQELLGNDPGLLVYFPFNQGVACGDNRGITTLTDKAEAGGFSHATLHSFDLIGACASNFTNGNPNIKSYKKNGLTTETASTSAFQIKQDFPGSPDGLYWIKNTEVNGGDPFQIYADMTTDGGGWTLIMCNVGYSGWTYENAVMRNPASPSLSGNYSIIAWADHIKKSESGFQYMMDAESRNRWGGIWTANQAYSFVKTDNTQTDVTRNLTWDTYAYSLNNTNSLQPRMPWRSLTPAFLTTDDGTGNWWGSLITASSAYFTAPWISPEKEAPGKIWYWVR